MTLPLPQEGDLLFFSGRSIWSRLIRARALSAFSHVGMFVEINGELWVAESLEPHGLRVVPRTVWDEWEGEIFLGVVKLPEDARREAAAWMLAHVGCQYATKLQFVRSFSFIWSRVARWLRLPVDVDGSSAQRPRFFCSEAVAMAYRGAYWMPSPPAGMSPTDVARLPFVVSFRKWPRVDQCSVLQIDDTEAQRTDQS